MSVMFADLNEATIRVLQRNGCEVVVPASQTCCGQPGYNSGDRRGAQTLARKLLAEVKLETGKVEDAKPIVDAILKENGLERGRNGLRVVMMCEIPSNAILADEFLKLFDGFSIGSNDLTQLTLGLDRDSGMELLAADFDERDPAVTTLIEQAIKAVGSLDQKALAKYLHENKFKTIVGPIRYGPDGEWANARVVQAQFRGVKGKDLEQFRQPGKQVIVAPTSLKTGDVLPFDKARN